MLYLYDSATIAMIEAMCDRVITSSLEKWDTFHHVQDFKLEKWDILHRWSHPPGVLYSVVLLSQLNYRIDDSNPSNHVSHIDVV